MSSKRADEQRATARDKATTVPADLDARRSFVTDCLLLVAVALGVVAIINTILQAMREPQRWLLVVPLLGGCGVLLLLVLLRRRTSYRLRAWGLLLMVYLVAALFMTGMGSLGNGVLLLVVLPALAVALVGPYSGLVAAVLSVLVYSGFAGAAAMGILAVGPMLPESTLDLTPWLPLGLATGFVLVALVLLGQVMRVQTPAPAEGEVPMSHLPGKGHDPEAAKVAQALPVVGRDPEAVPAAEELPARRVAPEAAPLAEEPSAVRRQLSPRAQDEGRYARLLEAAAEISRQALRVRQSEELLQRMVELLVEHLAVQHVAVYLVEGRSTQPEPGLPPAQQPDLAVLRPVPGPVAGQPWANLQTGDSSVSSTRVPPSVARLVERLISGGEAPLRAEVISGEGVPPQIMLPLRADGRLGAVLHVVGLPWEATVEASDWREEEIVALEVMADQLAVALENAQILEEAETRLQELDAAQRHYTTEAWSRFIEGRRRTAYRWVSPDSGAAGPGDGSAPAETSADGLAEDAWQSLTERVRVEDRPVSLLHEESGQHVLAVPVRLRDALIGVLAFRRAREGGTWQEAEIAAIEGVASRMAFAAENLRLLEEAQRRAAREEALSQMTAHFARSFNMDTVLRAAVRELGRLPDVAEVSVFIGESEPSALPKGEAEGQER